MIPLYAKKFNVKFHDDYYNKIYWESKKANDCIGVKLITDHWNHILIAKGYGFLEDVTHFIYLEREDKILQAISQYRAWTTGIWEHNKKEQKIKIPYNSTSIQYALNRIEEETKKTINFLDNKVGKDNYLKLVYETDIVECPEQAIYATLMFLGLPITDLPNITSDQIKGNITQNLEWRQQFLSEKK